MLFLIKKKLKKVFFDGLIILSYNFTHKMMKYCPNAPMKKVNEETRELSQDHAKILFPETPDIKTVNTNFLEQKENPVSRVQLRLITKNLFPDEE